MSTNNIVNKPTTNSGSYATNRNKILPK